MQNFTNVLSAHCLDQVRECMLYYDRRDPRAAIPPALAEYMSGDHVLYLKQVPSTMILRRVGRRAVEALNKFLGDDGLQLNDVLETSTPSDSESEEEEEEAPEEIRGPNYEDPWKIFSAWSYSSLYQKVQPRIHVWAGGCTRITDRLLPKYFGSERKNSCQFVDVSSSDEVMWFIANHTFWGHRMQVARKSGTRSDSPKDPIKNFAETLWRRISHLIRGKHDPLWTREERDRFHRGVDRDHRERKKRFCELLKTVDGIFLQRFLTFPEERWTWEKFDLFSLQAIQILITDEFLDGELGSEAMSLESQYSRLKSGRKLAKMVLHKDHPLEYAHLLDEIPRWVQDFLRPAWDRASRLTGHQRIYAAGVLSQTRGAGTPPPMVVLQSKEKFLRTVAQSPRPVSQSEYNILDEAMEQCMRDIPGYIFTGLSTKARVTVTGSACWEQTRKEGGTAEAILQLMGKYDIDPIPVRSLDTGLVIFQRAKHKFDTVGEAVFYACLNEVLDQDIMDLRRVFLTTVKEPGKARSVTKGMAPLKIVLDTVSKIVSWPLRKGFKSSESGMGRSNHGWTLFRDMFSEEMYEDLFYEEEREDEQFVGYTERLIVWRDMYASSTDYQEATDRMSHTVGRIIADHWMRKCGIPPVLRGIVSGICFQERDVYFTATGHLDTYGSPSGMEGIRRIRLQQGILMGDPLTKVVLHFSNILARRIGTSLRTGELFRDFTNGTEAIEIVREELSSTRTLIP